MGSEVIVVPIIFLVTGGVLVAYFYLKNKERQLIIEKGLSKEEMIALYHRKRDPMVLLKIGMVTLFFGLGLGLGMMLQEITGYEFWIAFMLFVFTGIGFILAFFISRKFEKTENK